MRRLQLLAAVLAALSCGGPTEPSIGDLRFHKARWLELGIVSYDYDLTHSNEWFGQRTDRISVRNGVVTKIVDVATGDSIGPVSEHHGTTIADLFETAERVLEEADAGDGMHYHLDFDPALHFVRTLRADHERWADDAFSYAAANLVRR